MAKLTKQQSKNHEESLRILEKDFLTFDEKCFVLNNYNPAAETNVTQNGAFFTSEYLAQNFYSVILPTGKILDLCAGIGRLAFTSNILSNKNEIVCIEKNPKFVEVGKKIVPSAKWICADVFDKQLVDSLGYFDCVVSNPPFGYHLGGDIFSYWMKTRKSHFWAIEISMMVSDYAGFIVPKGLSQYDTKKREHKKSYIHNILRELYPNVTVYPAPIDYDDEWNFANVETEIIIINKFG